MTLKKHIILILLVFIASIKPSYAAEDMNKLYAEAVKLIKVNCGDCYKATKAGLEEGINKLKKFIAIKKTEEQEPLIILRNALNTMAVVYAVPDSEEKSAYREEKMAVHKKLLNLYPDDVDVLYEYSVDLRNDVEEEKIFQRILELDPNHLYANYELAVILIQKNDFEGGFSHIRIALKSAVSWDYDNIRARSLEILSLKKRMDLVDTLAKEFPVRKKN